MIDPTESPVAAVTRVLRSKTDIINPSNMLVMMLVEAVQKTTPAPRAVSIAMLTKILQSLDPDKSIDEWATRSAREIVGIMAGWPEVKRVAELVQDEAMWCILEGTIAALLIRVCQGKDLDGQATKEPDSPT